MVRTEGWRAALTQARYWVIPMLAVASTGTSVQAAAAPPATQATAAAPPSGNPTDLSLPMFAASAGDPAGMTVAPAQNGPPGTVTVTQEAPLQGYSFDEFRHTVQGYVSAGVSSHGGRGVEGGVLIPLVPGKVELEVGAGTGRIGDLYPGVPRLKHATVGTTDYHATLHVHPSDDLDITISYAGANLSRPQLTR